MEVLTDIQSATVEIFGTHTIYFNGPVDDNSVEQLEKALLSIYEEDKRKKDDYEYIQEGIKKGNFTSEEYVVEDYKEKFKFPDINLYIKSNGGVLYGAFSVIDLMERLPNKIITHCMEKCYSAGLLILNGGDERRMAKHAEIMYHKVSIQHEFMKYEDLKEALKKDKETDKMFVDFFKKKVKPGFREDLDTEEDLYLNAKEAFKYGFIDRIE